MVDTAIWVVVILAGVMALGVAESARSGRLAGVNWQSVKTFAVGAAVIFIAVTSGILAVTWAIVIVIVEIWQPFVIFLGSIAGVAAMIALLVKHQSVFVLSALVVAVIALLLFL